MKSKVVNSQLRLNKKFQKQIIEDVDRVLKNFIASDFEFDLYTIKDIPNENIKTAMLHIFDRFNSDA